MKNKKIILFIIIAIAIVIIFLFIRNRNKDNKVENNVQTEITYNESEGMYEIRDENNEVISNSVDRATLQIYIDDPNYNP